MDKLTEEDLARIRTRGSVVIKDVVDDAEATEWKNLLDEFVKKNPVEGKIWSSVSLVSALVNTDIAFPGFPEGNKQFFQL